MEKLVNSFMNEYTDDFLTFFEQHREEYLSEREDYKKIENEIRNIKDKFPNIQVYLDNETLPETTNTEKEALRTIVNLKEDLEIMELKESFKLGCKEAIIFLKEMNMLKI